MRPSFETITRNGAGVWPRLIRCWRKSSETPSRTLSRSSVVCPSKTASASARCRNKCCLSSRDVKSTGVKLRVVILPSSVIANVALTNGRSDFRAEDVDLRPRATRLGRALLRLRDFMFCARHLALHFADPDAFRFAARFIEEV